MDINLEMEIRHLPYGHINKLSEMSQIGNCWREIMGLIPKDISAIGQNSLYLNCPKKYSSEDISYIAEICCREHLSGMEVLIEEWGTSGIVRPKLKDLIWILQYAKQERAADYLKSLVNESKLDNVISEINLNEVNKVIMEELHFSFDTLVQCTNNFTDIPLSRGGNLIGKGAFGVVYKGIISKGNNNLIVAIKKLLQHQGRTEKQFFSEIEILKKCIHKNILKLEGFSCDGKFWCLLYEYMENGSLLDHLLTANVVPFLWDRRLHIAEGIAEGLNYLHTNFSPPLIHRDIKSPNILLEKDFTPKIGDFGLVHLGINETDFTAKIQTTLAIGTSAYMAPEAFRGDVSIKMDTFSYAVLLLELLTGLPSYDKEREGIDLLTHIIEYDGDLLDLLDENGGNLHEDIAKNLFDLALICTKEKRNRPKMGDVLDKLKNILIHM